MPYVLQERRPALDKVVDALSKLDFSESDDMVEFLVKLTLENKANREPLQRLIRSRVLDSPLQIAKEVKVKPNGDINYILFKLCKYHVKPSYNNYKLFIGDIEAAIFHSTRRTYIDEFREAAEWIRIKLLTPYEEKKLEENGDV